MMINIRSINQYIKKIINEHGYENQGSGTNDLDTPAVFFYI